MSTPWQPGRPVPWAQGEVMWRVECTAAEEAGLPGTHLGVRWYFVLGVPGYGRGFSDYEVGILLGQLGLMARPALADSKWLLGGHVIYGCGSLKVGPG